HLIEEKSRQRSILAIAEAADEHARRIGELFITTGIESSVALYTVYDKSIIDGVVRALTDVPVHEIGSRDGVMALLSLRDQFVFLGINVEEYKKPASEAPQLQHSLEHLSGPENSKARQELIEQYRTIMAKNVRMRVEQIRKDYMSLKQ